jgi:hypothetical protein
VWRILLVALCTPIVDFVFLTLSMWSTICATTCHRGKTAFPIASRGCQRKTKRRLAKNVGTFDQKVGLDFRKNALEANFPLPGI